MNIPKSTKPAIWGAVGGAVATIVIGFSWGGWITGGAAANMQKAVAQTAVVQAFTPLCVVKAEQQPEQISLMQELSRYQRDDFVIEAGWIDNVNEQYRSGVADACAESIIEGIG
jgi:pimeloyl-ACP methyl ester carboxylesterase